MQVEQRIIKGGADGKTVLKNCDEGGLQGSCGDFTYFIRPLGDKFKASIFNGYVQLYGNLAEQGAYVSDTALFKTIKEAEEWISEIVSGAIIGDEIAQRSAHQRAEYEVSRKLAGFKFE